MYNSLLGVEISSVAPYSVTKKGATVEGVNVTMEMDVPNAKVFDDVDFGSKRNGLSSIINGSLPIKGAGVRLAFIRRKDTTMDVDGMKNIPVTVMDIFTGPAKNGSIPVTLKVDVKRLDKEIAGMFSAALNASMEVKINAPQQELELPPAGATSAPKKSTSKGDGKKRTDGKLQLHDPK